MDRCLAPWSAPLPRLTIRHSRGGRKKEQPAKESGSSSDSDSGSGDKKETSTEKKAAEAG